MKARAAELRAEGKKGAKRAEGLEALLGSVARMAAEDRTLAEHAHKAVTATRGRAIRTGPNSGMLCASR